MLTARFGAVRSAVNRRDALVAIVLLAVMVASIATKDPEPGQRGGDLLAYALAVPLTLPFAVHRRWPMGSLAAVVGSFSIFAVVGYAAYPGLSLFAILYGIAAHSDRRRSMIAVGVCSAAMIVALATQPEHVVTSADRTSSLLAIAVAWLAGENSRSRRARWAALEERATMLENEREERDRRAVADERLRIARDLHDIVSHSMSVVAVQAGAGKHLLDSDPEAARRALANVETASRGALVEMRRMLGVLRDDDDAPGSRAPSPGLSNLADLVARVRDAGLGVSLTIDGDVPALPTSIDLAAYRIVQESLTNVMKYGGPVAVVRRRMHGHRSAHRGDRRRPPAVRGRHCRQNSVTGSSACASASLSTAATSLQRLDRLAGSALQCGCRSPAPVAPIRQPWPRCRRVIRVLVVDDQALIRGGLAALIDSADDLAGRRGGRRRAGGDSVDHGARP